MERDRFIESLDIMRLPYNEAGYDKFEIYTEYMIEYNKNVNLTAITDRDEIYLKHYLDSLSVLRYFDIKEGAEVIDIGTGAGFPSVPIKIIRQDIKMTLVDSLAKRIIFLNNLIEKLALNDIVTIHSRAEDLARKTEHREAYDICLSRAVANMSTLMEYCTPFIKKGGYLLCLKGQNVDEEIKNASNAMKELKCRIIDRIKVSLADSDLNHNIVVVEKIGDTPKAYPRKAGIPSKNPL